MLVNNSSLVNRTVCIWIVIPCLLVTHIAFEVGHRAS